SFVLDERRVLPAYNIGIASRRRCPDEHLRGLDEPCALFPGLLGGGCWLTVLVSLCTFIAVRRVGSNGLAGRQSLAVAAIAGGGCRRLGNVFASAAVGLSCECSGFAGDMGRVKAFARLWRFLAGLQPGHDRRLRLVVAMVDGLPKFIDVEHAENDFRAVATGTRAKAVVGVLLVRIVFPERRILG